MAAIALDLGGTKLSSALFTDDGIMLHRDATPLEGRNGDRVGTLIAERLSLLMEWADRDAYRVDAIGACVPGIYHADTGRVWAPNIRGWEDYPLQEELQEAVGDDLAVRVDSDRSCYILGETWKGVAVGCRDAIYLAVGTGIGAGILADGRVLRGHADIAGAIGWLALDRPYRSAYDACGCFEYNASGTGLVRVATDHLEAGFKPSPVLGKLDRTLLTGYDLFEALDAGDPLAREVFSNAVSFWGMAVANLVSLFNPEMIVFGGGVFGPASRFIDAIRTEATRWAQPISMKQVRLETSRLGGDAGLYGAGRLALVAAGEIAQNL